MSSDESTNATHQSPRAEGLDRAAENFPTWQLPRLVGIDHLNKMMAASRGRVNDSHRIQMDKLAEVTGSEVKPQNIEDEMSDFTVAGDSTTYNITGQQQSTLQKFLPLAISAAVGAGAIWCLLNQSQKPQPLPAPGPDVNWQLDLEVRDTP